MGRSAKGCGWSDESAGLRGSVRPAAGTALRVVVVGLAMLSVTTAGCSDAGSTSRINTSRSATGNWTQVRLPNVSPDAAYEAGVYAMQQWFRLTEMDPQRGVIQSAPSEYEQKGGTGRFRDAAIGYNNRMRRIGALVVQEVGEGCIVKCKVAVQRLDTADHRVFRSNTQFSDVPNETPIQQEAGVSPQQEQVWTDMPRDRGLERQVLDVVQNRLEGDAGTREATPAARRQAPDEE